VSGLHQKEPVAAAVKSADADAGDLEAMASPARRRFRTPANLYFTYNIYNAQLDKVTQLPKLSAAMRISRDGKIGFAGQPKAIDPTGQPDLKRINAGGGIKLGPDLVPGQYLLQIVVTDALAKEKQKTTTQWADFEIVKYTDG